MSLTRRIARPLLAGYFLYRGVQLLRNPDSAVASAQRLTDNVCTLSGSEAPKQIQAHTLVKATAVTQVACASLIVLGRCPRSAALTLAAISVPYAISDSPFWEQEDPQVREEQLNGLLADLSMVGGLLLAAVDTEGKPSLAWRTRTAARKLPQATEATVKHARRDAKLATRAARSHAQAAAQNVAKTSTTAAHKLSDTVADTVAAAAKGVPFVGSSHQKNSHVQGLKDSVGQAAQTAGHAVGVASQAASKKAAHLNKRAQRKAAKAARRHPCKRLGIKLPGRNSKVDALIPA